MNSRFPLSSSGRVAAAISLSLVCSPLLWAGGIETAPGSGMSVSIAPSGAEVVAIARPDPNGVSHNLANSYNIGVNGAVINNSIGGGLSQLAGQMQANAQLGGQAAAVVLAEVVSRNPSLLLGKQEMFGQAADFVLANPNGITCNGCGFINTPRASLLVGQAGEDADGRIKALNPVSGDQVLTVGPGGLQGGDVVDLIAPRIDDQGAVVALSGINALSGHRVVDYVSGQAGVAQHGAPALPLDSAYLGGMQAGRINIVSNDEGAGVNLSGALHATGTLEVSTHGKLEMKAADLKGQRLDIAANQVSVQAQVNSDTQADGTHNESWVMWQTGATDTHHTQTRSTIERSRLEGQQVDIVARQGIDLSASDVVGGNIHMKAGEIALSGVLDQSLDSQDYQAWKNSWKHEQHKEQESQRQIGGSLTAQQDIQLEAQGNLDLEGAVLKAGQDVKLSAGKDVQLAGLVEQDHKFDRGSRYLEGAGLETGSWDMQSTSQRLKQTTVDAGGKLELSAGHDLSVKGGSLQAAADLTMNAGGSVEVGTQLLQQTQQTRENSTNWGGIGGSDQLDNRQGQQLNMGSTLTSNGALSIQAEHNIKVSGSRVHGAAGALALARAGNVEIINATDSSHSQVDDATHGAFNIPLSSESGKQNLQVAQGSTLVSDTNLLVASGADIDVIGSQLSAGQALGLKSGGKITLGAAEQQAHEQKDSSHLQLNATAGLDRTAEVKARAELGLTQLNASSSRDKTTHVGSVLNGNRVALSARTDLSVLGSQVTALSGDADFHAQDLNLAAVYDLGHQTDSTDSTTGGGHVDLSLKNAGAGLMLSGKHTMDTVDSNQAQLSKVTATGKVTLDASGGKLKTEGASLAAGGALTVDANQIDNQAAVSRRETQHSDSTWSASQGQSVDVAGLSNPLIKVVNELKSGQFAQAKADAGKIAQTARSGLDKLRKGDLKGAADQIKQAGIPSLNSEIVLQTRQQDTRQQNEGASGSQFVGSDVQVHSKNSLNDQASIYQSGVGKVAITAASHDFSSLSTQTLNQSQERQGAMVLHATSLTGQDLTLKAALSGAEKTHDETSLAAQSGAIVAQNGIDITIGQGARYQGTHIDAGRGQLQVSASGDLNFDAAQSSQRLQNSQMGGRLEGELTLSANPSKTVDMGGGGKMAWDVGTDSGMQQRVESAVLEGQGGTRLQAGHDLNLNATRINAAATASAATPNPAVALSAGNDIAIGAVQESKSQNGWGSSGELGGMARVSTPKAGQADFQVQVNRDQQAGHVQSKIDSAHVSLDSGRDANVSGAVMQADTIDGHVGRNLQVSSTKDSEQSLQLTAALSGGAPDLSKIVSRDGVALSGKLQVEQSKLDAVTAPSRLVGHGAVDLSVAGHSSLTGASIESSGAISPAGGQVAYSVIPGSRDNSKDSGAFSGTPSGVLTQVVKDVLRGKAPLGISSERHSEDKTAPAAEIRL